MQRALLDNAELRAHVTTGDSLVLQDERGRLVPPESGAATVLDIHTGEVKLLVSVQVLTQIFFQIVFRFKTGGG